MFSEDNYTALEKARFERKFVAHQSLAQVEQMIKLNPVGYRPIYTPRKVNNIYFDTPNLNNYFDNHFGRPHRRKMRIRWYGEQINKVDKPILEFKMKRGFGGLKEAFSIPTFPLDDLHSTEKWLSYFKSANLKEEILQQALSLRPTLLNSYQRMYFRSFDDNYRITIDYDLNFFNIGNGFLEKSREQQPIIIELKYDVDKDNGAARTTAALPYRMGKFSKYAVGVECFHKHLAI